MKKPINGLFSVVGLKNNYLSLVLISAFLTISFCTSAQAPPVYDSTQVPQLNKSTGYIYKYVGAQPGGVLKLGATPPAALAVRDSGGMVYLNGRPAFWNGSTYEYMIQDVSSPDHSVNVTGNGTNIFLTVAGIGSGGNRLLALPSITLEGDTVLVNPNLLFVLNGNTDTITTGASYTIRTLGGDSTQTILLYINQAGAIDSLQGIISDGIAVPPSSSDVAIILGYINVTGSVDASVPNVLQETAVPFVRDGALWVDSTKLSFNDSLGVLSAPSFKSTVTGGVALSIDGGSAIRADRGSRVVYIDGDSSVTIRSGGYNHKAQLTAQGEFLIGSSGQVRIPSARLAVIDSTKGFLPPVMRGVRMNAISSPATGLEVYNTDSSAKCYFNGTNWRMNTLQHAFDLDQDRIPQINAHGKQFRMDSISYYQVTTTDIPNYGYINVYPQGIGLYTGDTTTGMPQTSIDASHSLIALTSRTGGIPNSLVIDSNVTYLTRSTADSFVRFGINTDLPDSALHVVGGIKQVNNYYTAAPSNTMLVIDTLTGGYGHQAIPGGGSTDTTSLSNRINLKAPIASPTFTGLITSPAATLTSTTTGFLPNRVTTTQMNAITPADGMMVYNTDEGSMFTYSTDWGWESNSIKYNTKFGTQYFNDLLGIIPAATAATQDGNIVISTINGGAVTTFTTPTANRQGIIELSTSTSATGRSYIATSNQTTAQSMILGGGKILYETSVQVPTLSTSGERFAFISGFTSALNNITIPNGAAFLYDEGGVAIGSAASANWQVLTASGGSRTYTTTATAVTAGQWYKLQVIVNAAATSVGFYINGTLVHTETSTIPTAAIGFANQIIKSNGTTARTVLVDYVYLKQKYTTAK